MDRVEQVTDELKRLVGWGADWRRVATMPTLRELAEAHDLTSYYRAGTKIMNYLIASIRSLEGPYEFYGRDIDAHNVKWAIRLLLRLDASGDSAPGRRYRAIRVLGLTGHTPEGWRRDPSPERDLLRILADHMCGGARLPIRQPA